DRVGVPVKAKTPPACASGVIRPKMVTMSSRAPWNDDHIAFSRLCGTHNDEPEPTWAKPGRWEDHLRLRFRYGRRTGTSRLLFQYTSTRNHTEPAHEAVSAALRDSCLSPASRMAETGTSSTPVMRRTWATAWCRSIGKPPATLPPRRDTARAAAVGQGA